MPLPECKECSQQLGSSCPRGGICVWGREAEMKTCGHCEGTGKQWCEVVDRGPTEVTCPRCSGIGRRVETETRQCSSCLSWGEPDNGWAVCGGIAHDHTEDARVTGEDGALLTCGDFFCALHTRRNSDKGGSTR